MEKIITLVAVGGIAIGFVLAVFTVSKVQVISESVETETIYDKRIYTVEKFQDGSRECYLVLSGGTSGGAGGAVDIECYEPNN